MRAAKKGRVTNVCRLGDTGRVSGKPLIQAAFVARIAGSDADAGMNLSVCPHRPKSGTPLQTRGRFRIQR